MIRGPVRLTLLAGVLSFAAVPPCGAQVAVDHGQLTARFDSVLQAGMQRDHVRGAAYVLVLGGRIAAMRGFGTADTAGRLVSPESTVFGLSSTTKLFTALVAARLAHARRIDLSASVERYLGGTPLAVPARGLTLAMLLTHTAGLDDPTIGSAARDPGELLPLEAYLSRHLTAPVLEPGSITSYSNIGVALAGAVIERAAGTPLAVLAESLVFDPLGMHSTTMRQPLPGELQRQRAVAFSRGQPVPQIYFNDAPASAAYSTVSDMGTLMAHLLTMEGGDDNALVSAMTEVRARNHPLLPGLTLAFREGNTHPASYLHGGDWQDFSNSLVLVPAHQAGFLVAFNTANGGRTARELSAALFETLGVTAPATPAQATSTPACRGDVAGTYRDTRMSHHTLARLGVLTGDVDELRVGRDGDDVTLLNTTYHPVPGTTLFRASDGRAIGVRCANDGVSYVFLSNLPATSFARVRWFQQRTILAGSLLLAWLVLTLAAVWRLLAFVRRASRRVEAPPPSRLSGVRWSGAFGLVLYTFVVVAMLLSVDPWEFQYGLPPALRALQLLSWPVALLAIGGIVAGMVEAGLQRAGARKFAGVAVHVLAMLVLFAHLVHWNLLAL